MAGRGDEYSGLPLPSLQQHLAANGVPLAVNECPRPVGRGRPWIEADQLCATDPALDELRTHLLRHRIKFVVFDMDMTVTASHTRGHLVRDPHIMAQYLESARVTDALKTMQLCRSLGLTIGIATFQREIDDAVNIGGSHLVRRVLGAIGAGDLVSDRDVIALNPSQYAEMVRYPDACNKNDLIRALFQRRGEPYSPGTTLLIDNTRRNVEAFVRIGGHGLLVGGHRGLVLQDTQVVEPSCTFVPGTTISHPAMAVHRSQQIHWQSQSQPQPQPQHHVYYRPNYPPPGRGLF